MSQAYNCNSDQKCWKCFLRPQNACIYFTNVHSPLYIFVHITCIKMTKNDQDLNICSGFADRSLS